LTSVAIGRFFFIRLKTNSALQTGQRIMVCLLLHLKLSNCSKGGMICAEPFTEKW
jgi:hypothetical protein